MGEEELHNSFPHPHMCKCLQTHKPTNMIHHTHMIHTRPTNNHKHQQTHKLRVSGLCLMWDILLGGLHQDCDDANKHLKMSQSLSQPVSPFQEAVLARHLCWLGDLIFLLLKLLLVVTMFCALVSHAKLQFI